MNQQHSPTSPSPKKPDHEADLENPPGRLPGLEKHNDAELGEHRSIVKESILPDSPTDDDLRGKA